MNVELQINDSSSPNAGFVGWAPSPCRIRVTNPARLPLPAPPLPPIRVRVRLRSVSAAGAGAVVFRSGTTGAFTDTLDVSVPLAGTSVRFFVAGKFGRPSVARDDVTIEARAQIPPAATPTTLVGRVRSWCGPQECREPHRGGAGPLRQRARHTQQPGGGALRGLPQHAHQCQLAAGARRARLSALASRLSARSRAGAPGDHPSVALPYWRFDQPAPKLFTPDFFGTSSPNGAVQFSATNPLQFWVTDGVQGVSRSPANNWNPATQPGPTVITEAATLALGPAYAAFRGMEGNPHGTAHTRWDGFISQIRTAAKDPLFFLLHCNVDRLWAKWQRLNGRFDPAVAASFSGDPGDPIGHNLNDTMWPWNGITGAPRPPTAPGGAMAASPRKRAGSPTARESSLDYQGAINAGQPHRVRLRRCAIRLGVVSKRRHEHACEETIPASPASEEAVAPRGHVGGEKPRRPRPGSGSRPWRKRPWR